MHPIQATSATRFCNCLYKVWTQALLKQPGLRFRRLILTALLSAGVGFKNVWLLKVTIGLPGNELMRSFSEWNKRIHCRRVAYHPKSVSKTESHRPRLSNLAWPYTRFFPRLPTGSVCSSSYHRPSIYHNVQLPSSLPVQLSRLRSGRKLVDV